MTIHPLLDVEELPDLERHLHRMGEVFAAFREQDSGCASYGVRLVGGERWFVKEAMTDRARTSMARGWAFHRTVQHPAIVPQVHRMTVGSSTAIVMPWRDGEVLYHPTASGPGDRRSPGSAMARFRALPVPDVLRVLEELLDAHVAVAEAGYVAVNFYDGSLLYDFTTGRVYLCDLDEYRPGPFTERMPGSKRFMAPEEFRRGAEVNVRTTVFNLGRAARLLLDAADAETQAGLLLVLYAQRIATISRLTVDHIRLGEDRVEITLGTSPVVLPDPLAGLVRELIATRRGKARIGTPDNVPWLFPGGRPGQPIGDDRLGIRLQKIGLQPREDRSAALFTLATDLPAAILARMLGIHIQVAVQWQKASAGDWAAYAADVSRRVPENR